jgi:Translocon-associated protein beta (TRAPB)
MLLNVLSLVLLLSSSIAGVASDEDFAGAKVFFHKQSATPFPLILGKNFVVTYRVYNGGETGASLVTVTDRYDPSSFDLIDGVDSSGILSKTIDELGAGDYVCSFHRACATFLILSDFMRNSHVYNLLIYRTYINVGDIQYHSTTKDTGTV